MAKSRNVVLMNKPPADAKPGAELTPMGSRREVVAALERFNTSPDGSVRKLGMTEVLHGPGLVAEIASTVPEVAQVLVRVTDDDIAWPVLLGVCRTNGWAMVDVETGRAFS